MGRLTPQQRRRIAILHQEHYMTLRESHVETGFNKKAIARWMNEHPAGYDCEFADAQRSGRLRNFSVAQRRQFTKDVEIIASGGEASHHMK